jgi:penicillin-binding protein 1A
MHPLLKKWFIIFVFFVLLGVVGTGAAIGALLSVIDKLPPLTVLENYSPPEISRVYDRSGNAQLAELFKAERREFVHIQDVPQHLLDAFIAIEDERFFHHFGVDPRGIVRALVTNLESGGRGQGASTITMQVARNIVLDDKRRLYSRKIREILTALQIERYYSKEQILEFYINHIFFGERSNGVQAAAKSYFGKDVKDLTVPEAAMIAGLPKAPSYLSPMRDAERARDRRNTVLRNMHLLGYIKTEDELNRYLETPIELNPATRSKDIAPYFVDYVRYQLTRDKSMDSTELGQKGYTVISSVDLNLQKICEEELSKALRDVEKEIEEQKSERLGVEASELGSVRKGQARLARIKQVKDHSIVVTLQGYTAEVPLRDPLPYFNPPAIVKPGNLIDIYVQDVRKGKLEAYLYDKSHVQGSAVLLDVKTGEILALVGGDDFHDNSNSGQWNRAFQGGRQPGSCWKPLLYGAAMDVMDSQGKPRFTPGYLEIDEPLTFADGYSPKNYEGSHYGPTCLYEALVKSRNVPTIKLFMDIGPKKAIPLYHKFNMVNRPSNWNLDAVPPMALGTPNVSPLELAAAYAVFANQGVGITPHAIRRKYSSKSPSDSAIERPDRVQVLTPQAAFITARIMQDVVKMGTAKTTVGKWVDEQTAKGRKLPEIAGKTGTTNNCFVAWFVGYTPELVLAIYVGYDQHRTMGPKVVGGKTVGPIWVPMMDRILQTRGEWKMKFDVPPGITFCDICSKSGKRVTNACYASGQAVFANAAFKEGTAPTSSCGYHTASYSPYGTEDSSDPEGGYNTGRGASIGDPGDAYTGSPW